MNSCVKLLAFCVETKNSINTYRPLVDKNKLLTESCPDEVLSPFPKQIDESLVNYA